MDPSRTDAAITDPRIERLAALLAQHEPRLAERDPPFREAAVAVALVPDAGGLSVLLVTRAVHPGDPWSGQVALPGGRIEPHDESLLATAIREAREETALELSDARVLGTLDELRPRIAVLPPIIVRPHVFALPGPCPVVPGPEVSEAFWTPLDQLFDPARRGQKEVRPRGSVMHVDAIEYEGRVIWGMTERILRTLESVWTQVK